MVIIKYLKHITREEKNIMYHHGYKYLKHITWGEKNIMYHHGYNQVLALKHITRTEKNIVNTFPAQKRTSFLHWNTSPAEKRTLIMHHQGYNKVLVTHDLQRKKHYVSSWL